MGGGAGEWFRPFALTVATSVLVSLFISFTLDPMLSAYWGDPVGYRQQEKRGLAAVALEVQRLVRPPGRPLRQRDRVGAAPSAQDGGHRGRRPSSAPSRCRSPSAARASCPHLGRGRPSPSTCARRPRRASNTRSSRSRRRRRSRAPSPRPWPPTAYVNAERRARVRGHRQEQQAQALRVRDRAAAAQAAGAHRRRRVHGARRPQQRRRASRCRSSSPARIRAGSWRSPPPSWRR